MITFFLKNLEKSLFSLFELKLFSLSEEESEEEDLRIWITPGIKVRIISQSYKKGRYYNKKVN